MGCTTCTHTAGGACEAMKEGKLELKSLGRYFVSVFSHLRTKSHLYIHIYMYIYVCLELSLYIYVRAHAHTQKQEVTEHHQRLITSIINVGSVTFACLHLWSAFPFFFLLIYSSKIVTLQNGTVTDTT